MTLLGGTERFRFAVNGLAWIAITVWAVSVSEVRAEGMRAEFQLGIQGGDPAIEFNNVSDILETDEGFIIGAGLWFDEFGSAVGLDVLSIGLEYSHLDSSDFNEPGSGTLLGAAITGSLDIEPNIDYFLINAALRDNKGKINPKFHPYIGGGLGFAWSSVDINSNFTVTVNGRTFRSSGSFEDDDTNVAGQVFVGADFDITDNCREFQGNRAKRCRVEAQSKGKYRQIYGGINASYYLTDATLFDADVEFRNFAVKAILGYKF